MQAKNKVAAIASADELLAHAMAIEMEAAERYAELADQMETHNNPEVAELFSKLAEIEGKHIQQVRDISGDVDLSMTTLWKHGWVDPGASEAPEYEDVHYLMQPYHAISLALRAERRAVAFFTGVEEKTDDKEVAAMARRLAEDERKHVSLLEDWLDKLPEPDEDWADDPDPPVGTE